MPDRGQNAAQHLCLDNVQQRQAIGSEHRVECITGTFERGKSQADCGAKNHSVTHTVAGRCRASSQSAASLTASSIRPTPR